MLYVLNKDKEAKKVTQEEFERWARRPENAKERVVGHDRVGDLLISTTFLCIDYSNGATGKPLLFESVIMKGLKVLDYWRYSTWELASKGHQDALKILTT